MIRAIALDDEPLPLRLLKGFSAQTDFVDLQGGFTSPVEAYRFIEKNDIDLLFLDIQMPGITGIDFLRTLPKSVMVIFTTAYSEYAVEGFDLNAIDYLLKPFEFERFLQAVTKANELLSYQQSLTRHPHALFVKADQGVVKVILNEILYIEGLNNYLKIYIKDKKPLLVRMSVKEMEAKVSKDGFMRVHRSYIIPVANVASVGNKTISLGYAEIPIGINYIKEVQSKFRADI